jgi:hypothetical protein
MSNYHTSRRNAPRTWLYIVAFVLVAVTSFSLEKEIEINQLSLPIDYD